MKRILIPIFVYISVMTLIVLSLKLSGYLHFFSIAGGLLNWDAHWYQTIADHGYIFVPEKTCNLAFFPLFPAIWSTWFGSAKAVAVFNGILFLASVAWLAYQLRISQMQMMLYLCTGSLMFFYLPYSESLFFLYGSILLVGYQKDRALMICAGLFLISLVRAVTVIFVPILLFVELTNEKERRLSLKRLATHVGCAASGMMVSACLQYLQTGKLFYFMQVQRFWRRSLAWPVKFPLTTYSSSEIIAIDSIALGFGLIAILICIHQLHQRYFAVQKRIILPSYARFSAAYLSAVTVIDLLFTFHANDSSSIWSLNRHILCTPFYLVTIKTFFDFVSKGELTIPFFSIIPLVFFSTETKDHPFMGLIYAGFFSYLFLSAYGKEVKWPVKLMFTVFGVGFQVYLFFRFIQGNWVG